MNREGVYYHFQLKFILQGTSLLQILEIFTIKQSTFNSQKEKTMKLILATIALIPLAACSLPQGLSTTGGGGGASPQNTGQTAAEVADVIFGNDGEDGVEDISVPIVTVQPGEVVASEGVETPEEVTAEAITETAVAEAVTEAAEVTDSSETVTNNGNDGVDIF